MKEEIWEDSLIVFGNNVCISSLLFFLGKPGVDNNNLNVLNVFQKKEKTKRIAQVTSIFQKRRVYCFLHDTS